jgi:AraC-like DNA-binding protein
MVYTTGYRPGKRKSSTAYDLRDCCAEEAERWERRPKGDQGECGSMAQPMHSIHFREPSDATKRFIRFYAHRESKLGSTVLIHPVPARSEQVLDFEFGDPIQIHSFHDGVIRTAETSALIGLQTHRRVEQFIQGQIKSFSIFFQPAALSLLFALPAVNITDSDYDARGSLGRSVGELRERLGTCVSFHEQVRVAEEFFLRLSSKAGRFGGIELAAHEILRQHGVCRMDALARDTGLSGRTFRRRFSQSIGVSPKLYARIVRFESALQTKAVSPQLTWTDIAYEYGYHDQMHMIHDFQQLSTDTPSGLWGHVTNIFSSGLNASDRTHARVLL